MYSTYTSRLAGRSCQPHVTLRRKRQRKKERKRPSALSRIS
jgi:hypothetical protein